MLGIYQALIGQISTKAATRQPHAGLVERNRCPVQHWTVLSTRWLGTAASTVVLGLWHAAFVLFMVRQDRHQSRYHKLQGRHVHQ